MMILIDNGHGEETPGKRSPDSRVREWRWNRDVASKVERILTLRGIQCQRIVASNNDVPLKERVRIVNEHCRKFGSSNVALISIHINAAGAGSKWMNAQGWSVFVAQNASAKSKLLAECLFAQAAYNGWKVRTPTPTQKYWVQSLAMCRDTNCPAVLVENFFMDNQADCDFLCKEENKDAIAQATANGIINYIEQCK